MAGQSGEEKPRIMVTATGYYYSDASSSRNQSIQSNQFQSFDPNPEIYNLATNMEMIGFPSKNLDTTMVSQAWNNHDQSFDPSLRCVFPCEGNERPSQGLSLSLSSSNPSSIGLQSFELRRNHDMRFDSSGSRPVDFQQQQLFQVGNSKYFGPAQELLNEFCNLALEQTDSSSKMKIPKNSEWVEENVVKKQRLYSLDLLELQKRRTKLVHMLEEVHRRYKLYSDQMKALASSFEAVAGNGAATAYTALASRAMSRHFRWLKDAIVIQIKGTKKAIGEKDAAAPGSSKGETPRLSVLDQTLRQQRAFQQMGMMESHPWRPQRGLPERSVSVLRAWLFEHFLHPYPSDVDKHILARQTGLSRSQVSNWFINARVRLWKPMVEEMYLEDLKEQEGGTAASDGGLDQNDNLQNLSEDQKPMHDQLISMDSESLSSILINNPAKNECKKIQNHEQHSSYPAMGFDFSSYSTDGGAAVSQNYGSGSGAASGVSLTLGLHQHGLFYPRSDNMDDCQTVQYSFLDGESQQLPYRNLMGAQLLHDFAG